jgi:hypothetical protein
VSLPDTELAALGLDLASATDMCDECQLNEVSQVGDDGTGLCSICALAHLAADDTAKRDETIARVTSDASASGTYVDALSSSAKGVASVPTSQLALSMMSSDASEYGSLIDVTMMHNGHNTTVESVAVTPVLAPVAGVTAVDASAVEAPNRADLDASSADAVRYTPIMHTDMIKESVDASDASATMRVDVEMDDVGTAVLDIPPTPTSREASTASASAAVARLEREVAQLRAELAAQRESHGARVCVRVFGPDLTRVIALDVESARAGNALLLRSLTEARVRAREVPATQSAVATLQRDLTEARASTVEGMCV